MQFITAFATLAAAIVGLSSGVAASPTPVVDIMTESEMLTWLSTTSATLTFIGEPIPKAANLNARVGGNVMVVYCSSRTNNVCGGACTVYNGGATCLNAPDTVCLSATANVGFCDRGGCGGSCNQFSSCGTRLDNNFCYTPGTKSIIVPFV
ncbi:hypothetical protein EXIGLDRAFT_835300 [Exidia glandulosa HHB12029]|uniref:Uncharacterized protein n=1 Tax=Exidia glandulosa HHB12029 TaxID=1314781 RepID=A0A165IWQ6_EXIGL|nr:hypothetical protein EXIGLDRAFT_835300 [Exidia glandulosa HHB12029]